MSILSFAEACNILIIAKQFFPLKSAILNYVTDCCLDCHDNAFLKKPNKDDQDQAPANDDEAEESDIIVLLKFIENINEDFEAYLNRKIIDYKILTHAKPASKSRYMHDVAEEYIFLSCTKFIRLALKRKNFDVGAFDMKFFNVAENLASLYYHNPDLKPEYKMSLFELLYYMRNAERHSKYLDNVARHPARKKTKELNEEFISLKRTLDNIEASKKDKMESEAVNESTNSSDLQKRIIEITGSFKMLTDKETEFEDMVRWISRAESNIKKMVDEK
jgi:hypothetical protein